MITHINTATVQVTDQDAAIDFYVNKLGFEKRSDEPMGEGMRWVVVGPPGGQCGIVLANGFGTGADSGPGQFTGLVLTAADIYGTCKTLQERGVKFTDGPSAQPWGMVQAIFEDQDGNGYVMVGQ
jgi:lactoylglutathione lyase